MRIGLLQTTPRDLDPAYNAAFLEKMARRAAEDGVELLMTCECYMDGYCARLEEVDAARLRTVALPADSPYLARVRALCRELKMGMILGYTALEGDEMKNTALLLGPDGEEIGRYCKMHLHAHDKKFAPGDSFPVFDTPWGRVGMLICADRRWPEAARSLRIQGAEMILIPTYGVCHERNFAWMCTRAYENECYLAFCHPQQSFVFDSGGHVLSFLQTNVPSVLVCDIDVENRDSGMFELRRTDAYVWDGEIR